MDEFPFNPNSKKWIVVKLKIVMIQSKESTFYPIVFQFLVKQAKWIHFATNHGLDCNSQISARKVVECFGRQHSYKQTYLLESYHTLYERIEILNK